MEIYTEDSTRGTFSALRISIKFAIDNPITTKSLIMRRGNIKDGTSPSVRIKKALIPR